MPNQTIFIRRDDLDKWRELKNKSQVISDLLNTRTVPAITIKEDKTEIFQKLKSELNVPMCKNGHPLDKWGLRCLEIGCKYA